MPSRRSPSGFAVGAQALCKVHLPLSHEYDPYSYQWYYGSKKIDGATGSELEVAGMARSNSGTYHVKVSNTIEALASRDAEVIVDEPISINFQPVGTEILAGESATMFALASGSGPKTYQWQKENSAGYASGTYNPGNGDLVINGSDLDRITGIEFDTNEALNLSSGLDDYFSFNGDTTDKNGNNGYFSNANLVTDRFGVERYAASKNTSLTQQDDSSQ